MDKLKMQSNNSVEGNIEKIKQLFPNCITEAMQDGKLTNVVDFDLLRQELSTVLVEGKDERYRLDWAGKRQAILTANSPIAKTLRPCREESVNFDTTENLYIEGDNLDVLKLLHETYLNKVKMIYIDPPYNTGNDFVYNDNFAVDAVEYLVNSNQKDEQGNRMEANKETSGRYHSDWLSMMYMRLKLAKELLTNDGVVFISIDDNEQANLKKICDEIFGETNYVANLIWKSKSGGANDSKHFAIDHEYIICYANDINELNVKMDKKANVTTSYNQRDEKGEYSLDRLDKQSLGYITSLDFPITGPDGKIYTVEHKNSKQKVARWRWGRETVKERYSELVFKDGYVYTKNYKKEGAIARSLLIEDRFGRTRTGKKDFFELFEMELFSAPKPIKLVCFLIDILTEKNELIMDFFSGSATTAHAVMQLNAEDGGNRKYIMVQLPELTDERSEAHKAGYKDICEIGKERIRRAGKKIADENRMTAPNLDIGFRVLKLDDSNMKDTFYNSKEYTQEMLLGLDTSIKEDRTAEDILFQIMLDKGVSLSSKIELRECEVGSDESGDQNSILSYYVVGETGFGIIDLICCLDKQIDTDAVKEIAKLQPECCVFLDSGMENDATRTNIQQVFDTYSPKTKVEVL